jgi:hypothetical protein
MGWLKFCAGAAVLSSSALLATAAGDGALTAAGDGALTAAVLSSSARLATAAGDGALTGAVLSSSALSLATEAGDGVLTAAVDASESARLASVPFSLTAWGYDNGPLCDTGASYASEALSTGASLIRTHDMEVLDWWAYFPHGSDPKADPEDPAWYDWTVADAAMGRILGAGLKPYFRVGPSWTSPQWSVTPANATLFARTSVRAVMHFNEGWGGGNFSGRNIELIEVRGVVSTGSRRGSLPHPRWSVPPLTLPTPTPPPTSPFFSRSGTSRTENGSGTSLRPHFTTSLTPPRASSSPTTRPSPWAAPPSPTLRQSTPTSASG